MAETVSGILKIEAPGAGVLLDPMYQRVVARVPSAMVREYEVIEGASITGLQDAAGGVLTSITTICGLKPQAFRQRTPFESLVAIDPTERFDFGASDSLTLRLIDLVAPIAGGTRGLIVSPPKAGKTMLLEQMARGIRALSPTARILMLLLDERPGLVTVEPASGAVDTAEGLAPKPGSLWLRAPLESPPEPEDA